MNIYIDDGPNVGLSQSKIGISYDNATWQGISKNGLNVKSAFTPGVGRHQGTQYPYTNACIISLESANGSEIKFDIQDVRNQPWQNSTPDLTGQAELATAMQTINSW